MIRLRFVAGLLLALLAACRAAPDWPAPAPAIWQVTSPAGETGWLFGTVHALPAGLEWRTPALARVQAQAGVLLVEIADPATPRAAALLRELGETPGQPPLLTRVAPADRADLAALLDRAGLDEADFAATESWAAALVLAGAVRQGDPANGVDRALIAEAETVEALETLEGQLALFDRLPAAAQSALLSATAREAAADQSQAMLTAWLTGDEAALAALDQQALLAQPVLREALLTGRNARWLGPIEAAITSNRRPLVAVGAAHLLGADGLPALLGARGYRVARLQ